MTEQFEQWLKNNSITEVECLVPDLGGIARGKILPTDKFIKGINEIIYFFHLCSINNNWRQFWLVTHDVL